MKKILFASFLLFILGSIVPASAAGIMVHDVGLNSAQDASYLSVYKDTQVTDIIFSTNADSTILHETTANITAMGMNAWYLYEISSLEEFQNIDISSIPDGIYGIELDFMNETGLVQNGHASEVRTVINSKMREIRAAVPALKIAVKLPSDDVTAYDNGLDVYTWSDEKLVDMCLISPYHNEAETDMSLDIWRSIIDSDIEIAGVIGTYMNTPAAEDRMLTLENAAALSNVYLSSGADKIYLEDFMYQDGLLTYEPYWETGFNNKSAADTMIRECGSAESLKLMNKRFVISNSSAVGNHSSSQNYNPLPLTNAGTGFSAFRIKTGNIADTSNVKLLIGCSREDGQAVTSSDIAVFMNSNKLTYEFTADCTYLKSDLSGGKVLVYSVNTGILNDINQVIELKSNAIDSEGTRIPITVDYVEMRESAGDDAFIYRNMSEDGGNIAEDSETGRNVVNAEANTSLSYEVELDNDGRYALSLCYKSDSAVNLAVNGRTYTLPAHEEYIAFGFAVLNLKNGKNIISFTNDAVISYNYFVLCKADTYLTKNGEELLTLENGQIIANAKLSGLMKGQELVLTAALYNGEYLEKVYYDKQTVDTDNYMLKVPIDIDISENDNYSLKIFLWNSFMDIDAYAKVKIY